MENTLNQTFKYLNQYEHILIDANYMAHRYGRPLNDLTTLLGRPSGLEFGFFKFLMSLPEIFGVSPVYWFCWDGFPERATRIAATIGVKYKGNRKNNDSISDWGERFNLLRSVAANFGQNIHQDALEADEVIANLSRYLLESRICILSADKDLHQLLSPTIDICTKPGDSRISLLDSEKAWGVPINKLTWLRALIGDSSDNLKGCGVPKKVLVDLVKDSMSPEQLEVLSLSPELTASQRLKLQHHMSKFGAYLSIMSLEEFAYLDIPDVKQRDIDFSWIEQLCSEFEFNSLSIDKWKNSWLGK